VGTVGGLWSLLGIVLMLALVRPWSGAMLSDLGGRVPTAVPGTMEG